MTETQWLSDEAWSAIEPHLPKNRPGAHRVDDRRVISGILFVLKAGCRWADCPPEFGPVTTTTTAARDGARKASGDGCSRTWRRQEACPRSSPSTPPTSKPTAQQPGQKGGSGPGDRPLA